MASHLKSTSMKYDVQQAPHCHSAPCVIWRICSNTLRSAGKTMFLKYPMSNLSTPELHFCTISCFSETNHAKKCVWHVLKVRGSCMTRWEWSASNCLASTGEYLCMGSWHKGPVRGGLIVFFVIHLKKNSSTASRAIGDLRRQMLLWCHINAVPVCRTFVCRTYGLTNCGQVTPMAFTGSHFHKRCSWCRSQKYTCLRIWLSIPEAYM